MFGPAFFGEPYYGPTYYGLGVLGGIDITVPPPGGGDSSKGGFSYDYIPRKIRLPEEFDQDHIDRVLREDKEIIEFIQFMITTGLLE